jgi:type IV pilus assembly protein PilC
MPKNYQYKVRDRYGIATQGILAAESETAVASVLSSKGFFITEIKEQPISLLNMEIELFNRGISSADLAIYARQFSVMIDAGMPLLSVLNVLVEQTENKKLKTATQSVLHDVQGGDTLAQAMGKHSVIFPAIMVSLVEAGELSGVLDDVMERLATHLEKEHKLTEKVKGAMTYPVVIMVVAALVVIGIVTFILPTFEGLFNNANVALPLPTQILLTISHALRHNYIMVGTGTAGLLYIISKILALPSLRLTIDGLKLKLPIFGDLIKKIAVARFCRTLSTLLRGGVNLLQALEVVKKVAVNQVIENTITKAQTSIKEGHGLAPQLMITHVFPTMVVRMIAIGEETGELDKMLEKVADFFESEVEDKINNFTKLIEPLLIASLSVVIGFIVISIMMPMFKLSTTMH